MQQPQQPGYASVLADTDPRLSEWVASGREFIISDGALSAKVKTLMTMLCDALLAHENGVKAISDRARAMGASEDEISETIRVAFWMGGLPALVTGVNAFRED
jgi:alkylhydroperoxidase/carboxymuconolactone decarboxylase family protein YurZ